MRHRGPGGLSRRRRQAAPRLLRVQRGGPDQGRPGHLAKNAACIKDRAFTKVTVEGNCDDRGTVEYNLQLGQRRADSAKKFLVNLGVPAKAIKTVSFGKERPICTEQVESCWSQNRRDDLVAQ